MNRTDRLVAMVMFLQGRRVVRAEELARHFEVTVRTIYRDVAALSEAGVPVAGEAGVGYSLVKGYHLPPVMFTAEEAMALFVGGEMVKKFSDASLAAPMDTALLKIRSVLPRERQDELDRLARATAIHSRTKLSTGMDQRTILPVQQAIVSRRVLRLRYRAKGREAATVRDVEPLGIAFSGGAWYLVAWCRLRQALRHFKLERLLDLEVLPERFEPRPDFSLTEHLRRELESDERLPARVWFATQALDRARREVSSEFVSETRTDGGVEVEMTTFCYQWLARWLLSFGAEAEAISPPELRERVAAEVAALSERYTPAPLPA